MENSFFILEVLAGFGAIIAGIGYAYGQFKKGSNQGVRDVVDQNQKTLTLLENQVESLQAIATNGVKQINELQQRVSTLEGVIAEKDKEIAQYLKIFQDRNPEMTKFMEEITAISKRANGWMTEVDGKIGIILQKVS